MYEAKKHVEQEAAFEQTNLQGDYNEEIHFLIFHFPNHDIAACQYEPGFGEGQS